MRAILRFLPVLILACDGGSPGDDVPAGDTPPADAAPDAGTTACALTLAVVDDFGAPAAGRTEVDLRVPYAGTRDLVVRCTRDGEARAGVPIRFTLESGSGRLALDRDLANSGDGGLARVVASWPAGGACDDFFRDTVTACLDGSAQGCLRFHLWTGRGADAAMLSVTATAPTQGRAPYEVIVTLFGPGDDAPACAALKPFALPPMAAVQTPPFAPGSSFNFQSLPGSDQADYQTWTLLARGLTAGGSLVAWACADAVRTSRCDQGILGMRLGEVPLP